MNIAVPIGLFNSAKGTVVAIIYSEGQSPPSMPEGIVLEMDHLSLAPEYCYKGLDNHVLIRAVTIPSETDSSVTRTQFPIWLAYAFTVHKS